jgi:hypothetical protein|tara:strand:+ start:1126 stop:1356 length:231 start_codon:yes stop_codon:yes gene_type:complete
MDIIKVNQQSVKADMEQYAFEINCILAKPEGEGSLERLNKATARYSRLSAHMQVLNQLETQTQAQQVQEQPLQDED